MQSLKRKIKQFEKQVEVSSHMRLMCSDGTFLTEQSSAAIATVCHVSLECTVESRSGGNMSNPTLGRLRQGNCEFEARLVFIARSCLTKEAGGEQRRD